MTEPQKSEATMKCSNCAEDILPSKFLEHRCKSEASTGKTIAEARSIYKIVAELHNELQAL